MQRSTGILRLANYLAEALHYLPPYQRARILFHRIFGCFIGGLSIANSGRFVRCGDSEWSLATSSQGAWPG